MQSNTGGQDPLLLTPEDFINHQLIHFAPNSGRINTQCADWLELVKLDNVDPGGGIILSNGLALLNALIAGQGVIVAPKTLANDDLKQGTLVILLDIKLPTELA